MSKKKTNRAHGKLRRSQVITTFGPGAMLDLPRHSVLVAGLDTWQFAGEEVVHEPRLVDKLKSILGVHHLQLKTPPPDLDDPALPNTGIGVWQFPEWFVTEVVPQPKQPPHVRSRMLVHRKQLQGKPYFPYRDGGRNKRLSVVPVRFVRACPHGHIGEIDWHFFVHRSSTGCRGQLWIDEVGTSADLSELFVRCECQASRCMSDAASRDMHALGRCHGEQPWLGPRCRDAQCDQFNRLLIRTASNSYFPQLLSVISLPERDNALVRAVGHLWTYLHTVTDAAQVALVKSLYPVAEATLEDFTDEQIVAEIARRNGGSSAADKSVKHAELEVLTSAKEEVGEDKPDGNFLARALPQANWRDPGLSLHERYRARCIGASTSRSSRTGRIHALRGGLA